MKDGLEKFSETNNRQRDCMVVKSNLSGFTSEYTFFYEKAFWPSIETLFNVSTIPVSKCSEGI